MSKEKELLQEQHRILLKEQNELLKSVVTLLLEMLTGHSPNCYGLKVHPGNKEEYCTCNIKEVKEKIQNLLNSAEK